MCPIDENLVSLEKNLASIFSDGAIVAQITSKWKIEKQ